MQAFKCKLHPVCGKIQQVLRLVAFSAAKSFESGNGEKSGLNIREKLNAFLRTDLRVESFNRLLGFMDFYQPVQLSQAYCFIGEKRGGEATGQEQTPGQQKKISDFQKMQSTLVSKY